MFTAKLAGGVMLGGILWLLAAFASLSDGGSLAEAMKMFPGVVLVTIAGVFWFTRNMDDNGDERLSSPDQQVQELQNRLRSTLFAAEGFESRGQHVHATHLRAEAAVIESQLRGLGS